MKTFITKMNAPLKILIISAFVILGTQFVFADWSQPPENPPNNNVAAPINVSSDGQIKDGGLTVAAIPPSGGIGFVVANGNVGIGTISPAANLHVSGASSHIRLTDTAVANASWDLYAQTGNTTKLFRIYDTTAAADRLDITSTGNVGIGFAAPTQKLDVNGYVRGATGLCIANDCRTAWPAGGATSTGPTGSGTLNYIPKWTSATTLGNSSVYDNGATLVFNSNGSKAGIRFDDSWLRLNPSGQFTSGIYGGTGLFRHDGEIMNGTGATNYSFRSTLPGGTTDGDVWFGHDITLGTLAGTGVISATINFPGGNSISSDYNTANASDPAHRNIYLGTNQGLIVGRSGTAIFTVDRTGAASANGFYYMSDRSLKENISPLQDSLAKIQQLQGVSFNWKNSGKASVGVIAQDVEKIYPELVNTDPKTGLKSVEYGNLVAPLIEAVKEQQKEIEELKTEVKELQKK